MTVGHKILFYTSEISITSLAYGRAKSTVSLLKKACFTSQTVAMGKPHLMHTNVHDKGSTINGLLVAEGAHPYQR